MERTRVWHGRVKPEHREEHEQFVAWLATDEAAEEPPAIIRFLRNPRMWPEYWEYESAGGDGAGAPEEAVRVRWRRGQEQRSDA